MEEKKYPLVSFLRGFLGFVYYFIIVCAILALVAFVALLVNPELETWNSYDHFGFMYKLAPLQSNLDLSITSSPSMGVDPELELLGAIRFKLAHRGWVVLYFLSMYFFIILFLYIIYQLRKFLKAVGSGDFFVKDNIARVRKIGFITILLNVVDVAGTLTASRFLTPVSIDHVRVALFWEGTSNIFQRHLHGIFMGLVILAIAEIFRFGARLQEDQELTV